MVKKKLTKKKRFWCLSALIVGSGAYFLITTCAEGGEASATWGRPNGQDAAVESLMGAPGAAEAIPDEGKRSPGATSPIPKK